MVITAARLIDGPPTITTSAGLTPGSGFTVNDFRGYRCGKNVELNMYLFRSGATIPVSGTGNFTPDVAACTVPSGWRPTSGTTNGNWDDGTAEGGFVIGTDGICTLRTTNGEAIVGEASSAGNGRNVRLHITFILDN
ncbi:hypothetical protein C4B68_24335 [Streptomyces dengpaensis]|uniref:Uncharacterized protein n=2 Tax=Streptomyces TaxID=1883 RepID=A0ABM6SUH8_9ACTN|nr:hypothetical protein C4B68_24335 [Streptomyces dengpaensis]PIB06049.1 hypothetical protein B1C81_26055 [Streptomyces sp. HG99]